jgi:hypothetical protein
MITGKNGMVFCRLGGTVDKFGERRATGVESAVLKTAFPPLSAKKDN